MNTKDVALNESKQALRDIKATLKAGGSDVADEVRAAAADVRSAASESADSMHLAGERVGKHARAAAGSAKVALGDAVGLAGEAASALMHYQRGNLRDWGARAENYIRTKPTSAFAGAAAVGFLFGLWMRGSRR